eukprot:CFRG4000T1
MRFASSLKNYGNVLGGANASEESLNTFKIWHGLVDSIQSNDSPQASINKLRPAVADNCVFKPPTYFTPWEGGDNVCILLSCAAETFGASFRYGRQWISDDGKDWALEFYADIADTGKSIDGIDLVKLDDNGRICEFTVLARPPNGVAALKSEMMKRVPPRMAAYKAKKALSSIFG